MRLKGHIMTKNSRYSRNALVHSLLKVVSIRSWEEHTYSLLSNNER